MYLLVGLGNPGREHEGQRHNVGFEVVDAIRRAEGWPDYKPKFSGLWTRGRLGDEDVVLLQPQTFMNLSGESVQPAAAFLKVPPQRIVVVHDELDLPWRDVRLKAGGGHAGHNGLRSIIQLLGTPEFARVRVGIGRPPAAFRGEISDWVLSRFDTIERAELPDVIAIAVEAVRHLLGGGSVATAKLPRMKK
ncbi:MAG: aminoacyl-tRNA hydrolase [Myxococcota bacterium]|nr:aminoacyl-tRNA hydrolase [Myxococcota bacterium]